MKLRNVIYCGDNLDWMRKMPDGCVDLIYADPPFFSNRHYEVIWNDGAEIRSFEDGWSGGINHYIEWMWLRCFEMHRILKPAGSLYLHCDWHASHYLKVMLDEVFAKQKCFRNEIVWCYRKWSTRGGQFARNHDVILFYTKNTDSRHTFNALYTDVSAGTMRRWKGRKQVAQFEAGVRKAAYEPREQARTPMPDWWPISILNPNSKERLGYPTQKPRVLLERIIEASSNPGHLVLDPFCGCGTTLAVAQRLGRDWIGIDVSPTACKLMKRRVEQAGATGVEIVGLPMTDDDLRSLKPFEFQNWVIGVMGGTVSERKVKDMGIDGYTYFERWPIQVKQQDKVGRPEVDKFETALERYGERMRKAADERGNGTFALKGIIVAFSFTKDAHEEVATAKSRGLDIWLMTVDGVRSEFGASS